MGKWNSRKLVFAISVEVVLGALAVINPAIAPLCIKGMVGVAMTYVGGQAYTDSKGGK